ncbi:hypothetical protein A5717_25860 [Mycolicibacterium porcinum]|uniref:hypothetical protein n=1 Tax=Mycolicibacterium porcinum TaxID=39693 RepID=UPI00080B2280|nr:hypothetical protein [Mycolicibacterium porcinum]OCB09206.1 hypothetical protein A5717_25860 [Mycolicibacterium porcinum]
MTEQSALPGLDPAQTYEAERFLRDLDEPLGHGLDLSTLPQIHRRLSQRYAGDPEALAQIAESADILRAAGKL